MRSIDEWIGAHDDQAIPARVQLRIYLKHNGTCPKCTRLLRPNKWECDHIVALANGGEHRESNLQPLCTTPCHTDKTRADRQMKARTDKRQRSRAGIKKRHRTMPGRRFNGDPIPARWIS